MKEIQMKQMAISRLSAAAGARWKRTETGRRWAACWIPL